ADQLHNTADGTYLSEAESYGLSQLTRGSLSRDGDREDLLADWLQRELGNLSLRDTPANRLRAGLIFLNPAISVRIAQEKCRDACELLCFSSTFLELLIEWHRFTRATSEPFHLLRRQASTG